jgi:hypothetical protein
MITGFILPAELKRNMERKWVPILTIPVWEIFGVPREQYSLMYGNQSDDDNVVTTNYEHENGHMVVNIQEGRNFHDEV